LTIPVKGAKKRGWAQGIGLNGALERLNLSRETGEGGKTERRGANIRRKSDQEGKKTTTRLLRHPPEKVKPQTREEQTVFIFLRKRGDFAPMLEAMGERKAVWEIENPGIMRQGTKKRWKKKRASKKLGGKRRRIGTEERLANKNWR